MPDEEIIEIDIDDIVIPGQEDEQNVVEEVAEEAVTASTDMEANPLATSSTSVEDEIDEGSVESNQLYEYTEADEGTFVEEPIQQNAVAEENLYQEIEQTASAPENSNERIRNASNNLEHIVQSVIQDDTNSLAATEIDIMEAKKFLSMHKLSRAKKSVHKAEQALVTLEEDVLYLRRSIAMLHRLLKEKKVEKDEVENILLRLRNATSAAEIGDVSQAANEVEYLVDDLIGGNTSTLNPFFFRHFWLGVDTRWPAGGDTGVLLVRLINDGPIAMPAMRLSPPVPNGWYSEPNSVDLPIIAPGGNLPLRFDIKSAERFGADEIPLSRKLAVSTGYEMRSGEIMVTIRAQNRSMEPLSDIVLTPWLPPGYTTAKVPFVERLSPDEVAVIRMQLTIDMGRGGHS